MQMMMRKSSKRRRFPIQILRRLLPGSMPRRLHKTHHLAALCHCEPKRKIKEWMVLHKDDLQRSIRDPLYASLHK